MVAVVARAFLDMVEGGLSTSRFSRRRIWKRRQEAGFAGSWVSFRTKAHAEPQEMIGR